MPNPQLIICPHTHMDTVKAAELVKYFVEGKPENRSSEIYSGNTWKMDTIDFSLGLMNSLSHVYKEFDKTQMITKEGNTRKLTELKWLKDELMSEHVFMSLLGEDSEKYFWQKNLIQLCKKEDMPCYNFTQKHFTLAHTYQRCAYFDMHADNSIDEASSQGISNGLTLVLMTENNLFRAALNSSVDHPIPGMNSVMATNGGIKGVRFIPNEPGIFLDTPDLFGVDLPPGMSATIGLTAQRIHHLPHPYTNCSRENPEIKLLMEAVQKKLGKDTPKQGEGMIKGTYSLSRCR